MEDNDGSSGVGETALQSVVVQWERERRVCWFKALGSVSSWVYSRVCTRNPCDSECRTVYGSET